jgi:hypothetical protein
MIKRKNRLTGTAYRKHKHPFCLKSTVRKDTESTSSGILGQVFASPLARISVVSTSAVEVGADKTTGSSMHRFDASTMIFTPPPHVGQMWSVLYYSWKKD